MDNAIIDELSLVENLFHWADQVRSMLRPMSPEEAEIIGKFRDAVESVRPFVEGDGDSNE